MNTRWTWLWPLWLIMLMLFPSPLAESAPVTEEAKRYMILFDEDEGIADPLFTDLAITYDPLDRFERIDAVLIDLYPEEVALIKRDGRVSDVSLDETVYTDQYWMNAGAEQIHAESVPANGLSGEGVKVGVMDTGISTEHPDLSYVEGYNFLDGNTDVEDKNGHGTHVAGILAAGDRVNGMLGVAPKVDLYVAKIMDERGQGRESNIVKSIEWAIEKELDIVNLSVGSERELNSLKRMLEVGTEQGILFVGAAGNTGEEELKEGSIVDYPARYPEVIAVGAVDSLDQRAFFSAHGPEVEVVAPGVRIDSTFTGTTYDTRSGTSMAAPFVSGMLAIMKEGHPSSTAAELRERLREPEWIQPLGTEQPNDETGYGRIAFSDTIPIEPEPLAPVEAISAVITNISLQEVLVDVSWTAPDEADEAYTYVVTRNGRIVYEGGDLAFTDRVTEDGDYTYRIAVSDGERVSIKTVSDEKRIRLLDAYEILSASFSDIARGNWYNKPLALMVEQGLINGYTDGTIRPENPISRGEVVTILDRYVDWSDGSLHGAVNFNDVPEQYFAFEAIHRAGKQGVVEGFSDGTFRPDQNIVRRDAAVILDRVFDYEIHGDPVTETFPDVSLSAYYGTAVMNLVSAEVATGYSDGTFRPGRTITRAEFAAFIQRTMAKHDAS